MKERHRQRFRVARIQLTKQDVPLIVAFLSSIFQTLRNVLGQINALTHNPTVSGQRRDGEALLKDFIQGVNVRAVPHPVRLYGLVGMLLHRLHALFLKAVVDADDRGNIVAAQLSDGS